MHACGAYAAKNVWGLATAAVHQCIAQAVRESRALPDWAPSWYSRAAAQQRAADQAVAFAPASPHTWEMQALVYGNTGCPALVHADSTLTERELRGKHQCVTRSAYEVLCPEPSTSALPHIAR